MQNITRLRRYVGFGLLFTVLHAQAVAPHDQASLQMNLGPDWKVIENVLGDDPTTIKYQKLTDLTKDPDLKKPLLNLNQYKPGDKTPPPPTERIETLSQRVQAKPAHVATNDYITQMGQLLTKGLSSKGCETGVPFLEPQTGDRFRVWVQVFQCQRSMLTGLQYYIDADAKNIYLITYTNTQYPFTIESRRTAEDMIKAGLKICYATDCYSPQ